MDWHSFRGKMWQDKMSHRKKDKSRERCLAKLGNCPPWYLSHSNLISPNKLHYCSVALFLSHSEELFLHCDSLLLPSLPSLRTRLVRRHLQQSIVCLPPLGPGSRGPSLRPPHDRPVQPLSLFTFCFLLFSQSSLCCTAKRRRQKCCLWSREVVDEQHHAEYL